jgi:hypothetical protein
MRGEERHITDLPFQKPRPPSYQRENVLQTQTSMGILLINKKSHNIYVANSYLPSALSCTGLHPSSPSSGSGDALPAKSNPEISDQEG